jgi:catechol 2,3-dioxygenase-like lactoylglutathione lyase family enzyme
VRERAKYEIVAIDHVQLAMPVGGEDAARAFYCNVLGLSEVPKPPVLAARGGCWFELGKVRLHLGVEPDHRPARKAHPALLVHGLDAMAAALAEMGVEVRLGDEVAGQHNAYVDDPFGNRIELVGAS